LPNFFEAAREICHDSPTRPHYRRRTEVKEAETYAEHMLALKQIKQLPDFTAFFDTHFVEAMEKKV